MAGKNDKQTTNEVTDVTEVIEEITYKATARQFIKYDGKFVKSEEEFQVKKSDVNELEAFADIEIPKETAQPPVDPGEGQGTTGVGTGENGGQ